MSERYCGVPDYMGNNTSAEESCTVSENIQVRVCAKCGTENSAGRKNCESCGEKLGEVVSSKEAETIGMDIRVKNGSEERSLTSAQVKGLMTAGALLSIAAAVVMVFTLALFLHEIYYYQGAQGVMTKAEDVFLTSGIVFVGLSVVNLLIVTMPQVLERVMWFMYMLSRPIRYIIAKESGVIDYIEDYDYADSYCKVCMIVPIITIVLSVIKLVALFGEHGVGLLLSLFGLA